MFRKIAFSLEGFVSAWVEVSSFLLSVNQSPKLEVTFDFGECVHVAFATSWEGTCVREDDNRFPIVREGRMGEIRLGHGGCGWEVDME